MHAFISRRTPLIARFAAATLLLIFAALPSRSGSAGEPRFATATNEVAWKFLPQTISKETEPLPAWARILAEPMPLTTASMLEMEQAQRQDSSLEPKLRAKIRWVAARTHGCEYTAARAVADLTAAGGNVDELAAIGVLPNTLPASDRRTFEFAERLCRAGHEVTDDEVQALVADHGAENFAAIVLVIAYANFQDRLINSLGLAADADDVFTVPKSRFDWATLSKVENQPPFPKRELPDETTTGDNIPKLVADDRWAAIPRSEQLKDLASQQLRQCRVPIPPPEVVERNLQPGLYPPGRATKILWNSVTFGYQPQLAGPWIFTLRRNRNEQSLNDEYQQSLFWVVTRSNECFY